MLVTPTLSTLPNKTAEAPKRPSIIQEIALDSLKELVVSLGMTAVTCIFVAEVAIPTMVIAAITTVAINTLVRASIAAIIRTPAFTNQSKDLQMFEHETLNLIAPYIFAIFDLCTRCVLVHETGHAIAANLVYLNPNTSIEVYPLKGGVTMMTRGALTNFGKYLGKTNSDVLVSAAGPLAASLLALIDLGVAHKIKDTHPKLHKTLVFTAIFNVANHAIYAISAFWENNLSHDFKYLWTVGNIHPATAAICIIALPIVFQGCLMVSEKLLN
jgi:hypothetical protein